MFKDIKQNKILLNNININVNIIFSCCFDCELKNNNRSSEL